METNLFWALVHVPGVEHNAIVNFWARGRAIGEAMASIDRVLSRPEFEGAFVAEMDMSGGVPADMEVERDGDVWHYAPPSVTRSGLIASLEREGFSLRQPRKVADGS